MNNLRPSIGRFECSIRIEILAGLRSGLFFGCTFMYFSKDTPELAFDNSYDLNPELNSGHCDRYEGFELKKGDFKTIIVHEQN